MTTVLPVEMRHIRADEIARLQKLTRACFIEYHGALHPPCEVLSESVADIERWLAIGGAAFAWWDQASIGAIRWRLADDCLELSHVAVLPEYRFGGFGKALIAFAEQVALSWKIHELQATARLAVPGAIEFLKRCEFDVLEFVPPARATVTTSVVMNKRIE